MEDKIRITLTLREVTDLIALLEQEVNKTDFNDHFDDYSEEYGAALTKLSKAKDRYLSN